MLRRVFRRLENAEQPLLGPNIKALKLSGLILPDEKFKRKLYTLIYIYIALFVSSQCADMWFVRNNADLLLDNLMTTTTDAFSLFKACLMYYWQDKWIKILEYVNNADREQRKTTNPENIVIITKYTRYCRVMTYVYAGLLCLTGVVFIFQPIFKNIISGNYLLNIKTGDAQKFMMIRSWVPFDTTTPIGYIESIIFQITAVTLGISWVISFDSTAIVLLVFFKVELQVLRNDSSQIFGTDSDPVDDLESYHRLTNCHARHIALIKYSRLLNTCLSPPMLVYILICSFTLCITASRITKPTTYDKPLSEYIVLIEYLVFCVSQLLLYCWHINEVTYESKILMLGPYESKWWNVSISRQKEICILIHQFAKEITFTAGPFADISTTTFVNVLKGAYSYYTMIK